MVRINGKLVLSLQPTGNVDMQFWPEGVAGKPQPITAAGASEAQSDLVNIFEFSLPMAQARIAELQKKHQVELAIAIDREKVLSLFQRRKPTVGQLEL